MVPLPSLRKPPGTPIPRAWLVSQGAHPQDTAVCSHPTGALEMLPQGEGIHWFPCPHSESRESIFALAPFGALFNFPPGERQCDWLSSGRKFKSAPAGARANACMLPSSRSIFKASARWEHTWCVPGVGSPGHRAWPQGMGSLGLLLAWEGGHVAPWGWGSRGLALAQGGGPFSPLPFFVIWPRGLGSCGLFTLKWRDIF